MTSSTWLEIACRVPASLVDQVADELVALTGSGVCVDNQTLDTFSLDTVAEPPVVTIKAYLPDETSARETVAAIQKLLDDLVPGAHTVAVVTPVHQEDWANSWKEHFKPTRVGERLIVAPTWEPYAAEPGDLVIRLDPGMAFGTGTHATTRLCLQALEQILASCPAANTLDVGCGSGILAISAALLGSGPVIAIDIDPVAAEVTTENARLNGVEERIAASITPLQLVSGRFDIVVANILAEDLARMAGELAAKVAAGGWLVLSGILNEKEYVVTSAFDRLFPAPATVTRDGDWCCLVYRATP
ncbi:50S ribosomal protein L11 methyltransferase [Geobacter argillaceus]|uniref:Ribosomal protein L11 methyltransferase n=1 Tax=Geobacter argillaceus TaxID=345631 RepID=A0A562VP51_9BACT|nr:50S ribosomal protein L11 methyltransferase [Geobacter argillaceus]TWJ19571.1 [LSU ribosomal protein L11P]-lysine N-methyltransferase [Geobacter argillaceus]